MADLSQLDIGDKAWRINSVRRHAFECTVVDVGKFTVGVTDDGRPNGRTLWYNIYTGKPSSWAGDGPSPLLVLADDPVLAQVRGISELEHRHHDFRGRMKELLEKLPGSRDDWNQAFNLMDEWEEFDINNRQHREKAS